MSDAEVVFALNWAANELMPAELHDKITVFVSFDRMKKGAGGYCDYYDKYRDFDISVNYKYNRKNALKVLFHEMAHVKQYATGELHLGVRVHKWQGDIYNIEGKSYWDLPWEVEAYGLEHCLYAKYITFNNTILDYM